MSFTQKMSSVPQSQSGMVALLDVDHTLLFDRDELNMNVVNALLQKGVTDVYLFTDMTFSENQMQDREKLIAKLQEQRLKVHGVISAPDLACDIPSDDLNGFLKDFIGNKISLRQGRETNIDKLPGIIAKYPKIKALFESGHTDFPLPGTAYAKARQDRIDKKDPQNIFALSMSAKGVLDILMSQENLAHPKGLLFRQFLSAKPDWVKSILVFDDNKDAIAAVKQETEKFQAKSPVLVTTITVESKEQNNYSRFIDEAQSKYWQVKAPTVTQEKLSITLGDRPWQRKPRGERSKRINIAASRQTPSEKSTLQTTTSSLEVRMQGSVDKAKARLQDKINTQANQAKPAAPIAPKIETGVSVSEKRKLFEPDNSASSAPSGLKPRR